MHVIDNFLPDEVFKNIYENIMGSNIGWYFVPSVAEQKTDKKANDNYMHYHVAYNNHTPVSTIYEVLLPLLQQLDIQALVRIIINQYPYTPKLKIHASHKDFDFKHKGAILYLNTCDGYTYCQGQKVYSVANRVLLHDPSKEHHSSATTNAQRRVICNVNYI